MIGFRRDSTHVVFYEYNGSEKEFNCFIEDINRELKERSEIQKRRLESIKRLKERKTNNV